jgi:xylulokinase
MAGLKGKDAYMGFSYLCWSGLCDVNQLDWSREICVKFDVDINKLPQIVDTFDIVGYVDQENADKSGLVSGIPIIAGGCDGSISLLGAGMNEPGMTGILAGTANALQHVIEGTFPDNKFNLIHQYSAFRNRNFIQNFDLAGRAHFWFIERFCNTKDSQNAFKELDKNISSIPQCSEKLMFFPNFQGVLFPHKPYVKGGWIGLDLAHTTEHMYKSILEGIAFNRYLDLIKIQETCNLDHDNIDELVLLGGGAKSDAWGQIYSDVLGQKIIRYKRNDFATLGSALIAAKAAGQLDDIEAAIKNALETDKIFHPDAAKHQRYRKYIEIYNEAMESLDNIFLKLDSFDLT